MGKLRMLILCMLLMCMASSCKRVEKPPEEAPSSPAVSSSVSSERESSVTESAPQEDKDPDVTLSDLQPGTLGGVMLKEHELTFPVPRPKAKAYEKIDMVSTWEKIWCWNMEEEDVEAYKKRLDKNGWVLRDPGWGVYVKDNTALSFYNEGSFEQGIFYALRYKFGYSGPERPGALSKQEAQALITQKILQTQGSTNEEKRISYIFEEDIGVNYAEMGVQVFCVGGTQNVEGLYLIMGGAVELVVSRGAGEESSICAADIDQDGESEILVLESGVAESSWESRFSLRAYKLTTPSSGSKLTVAYESVWGRKQEDDGTQIGMRMGSGGVPELYGVSYLRLDGFYPPTIGYGPIRVQGKKLMPTKTDDFLFVPIG